jgi:hypothetical protein
MANTYRALTPAAVGVFDEGVFEADYSPSEEKDHLDAGLLELVPRTYKVLSDNYQYPQGETFEAGLLVENEAALISGGHIERVDKPPAKKAAKATEEKD